MTDLVNAASPAVYTSPELESEQEFHRLTADVFTALPVKVIAVNSSGIAPVGTVDLQPLVGIMLASGQEVDHASCFNAPYMRVQGGGNALVVDPQVGDVGIAVFASRDISGVKRTRGRAPCGSLRRFSLSDAMYIGGILNQTPSQYIHMNSDGITVYSPTKVTIVAPEVDMDTPLLTVQGQMVMTGSKGSGASTSGGITNTGGTVSSNGIVLDTHVHKGVTSGSSNTGTPV